MGLLTKKDFRLLSILQDCYFEEQFIRLMWIKRYGYSDARLRGTFNKQDVHRKLEEERRT